MNSLISVVHASTLCKDSLGTLNVSFIGVIFVGFSRRRFEDLTFIYFRLVFYYIFNYWDCENYQFRSKSVVNLHWTVNCLLLCYWGIETWFEIGCYFVNIENLYIVTICHSTNNLKVFKLQLYNCKSVVYFRLWLIQCVKFIRL